MFNPEKDLNRIIVECLGTEGLSISSLEKKLSGMGIKDHRLILTGYLRAMADLGYLRMKDVPPSKIYVPTKKLPESVYQAVDRISRTFTGKDTDEIVLFVLYRLFKRPVFELELRMAGTMRPVGTLADPQYVEEGRRILRKEGNVIPTGNAYTPAKDYTEEYEEVLRQIAIENLDADHLVLRTKQTTLL